MSRLDTFRRFTGSADPAGCWRWQGRVEKGGYGRLGGQLAHRVSYEFHVGPIPPGLELDHTCRVRSCVNPAHLDPVTPAENSRRRALAKTHCARGHLFDEKNTYLHRGTRHCRACNRENAAAYKLRKAAA